MSEQSQGNVSQLSMLNQGTSQLGTSLLDGPDKLNSTKQSSPQKVSFVFARNESGSSPKKGTPVLGSQMKSKPQDFADSVIGPRQP